MHETDCDASHNSWHVILPHKKSGKVLTSLRLHKDFEMSVVVKAGKTVLRREAHANSVDPTGMSVVGRIVLFLIALQMILTTISVQMVISGLKTISHRPNAALSLEDSPAHWVKHHNDGSDSKRRDS